MVVVVESLHQVREYFAVQMGRLGCQVNWLPSSLPFPVCALTGQLTAGHLCVTRV